MSPKNQLRRIRYKEVLFVEEVGQIHKTSKLARKDVSSLAKVTLRPEELELCIKMNNPNASLDTLLRRFKKQVQQDGTLDECKRREFFLKKSLKRKEKSKRAKIARIKEMKKSSRRKVTDRVD